VTLVSVRNGQVSHVFSLLACYTRLHVRSRSHYSDFSTQEEVRFVQVHDSVIINFDPNVCKEAQSEAWLNYVQLGDFRLAYFASKMVWCH
jgi:hypothetical protein